MSKSVVVIGEGKTEEYYLLSLKGVLKGVQIEPAIPKHSTSTKELEQMIEKSIKTGYETIICLIDMDNKQSGKNKENYQALKKKYNGKTFENSGLKSSVYFIENDRCIEIWFLYHFKYTTASFNSSYAVAKELKHFCKNYEKTTKFLTSCGGLHQYLLNHKGNTEDARANAKKSMAEIQTGVRTRTYSQMDEFFKGNK